MEGFEMYLLIGLMAFAAIFTVTTPLLSRKAGGRQRLSLFGLSGVGDLNIFGDELKITYKRGAFLKRQTGTITYRLTKAALLINYEVKREVGERAIALDTIYSTSTSKQKRSLLFLVIGILFIIAAIVIFSINFSMLTDSSFSISEKLLYIMPALLCLVAAIVFIVLWYFQKRPIRFSILFGGVGEAGSGFLTADTQNYENICDFLTKINQAAQAFRDESGSKPVQDLIAEQNAILANEVDFID